MYVVMDLFVCVFRTSAFKILLSYYIVSLHNRASFSRYVGNNDLIMLFLGGAKLKIRTYLF